MLSERRKADRAKMAAMIAELVREECPAAIVEVRPEDRTHTICPRRVTVCLTFPRGLAVAVEFNGDTCQPDIYVLAWHMIIETDARLANAFGLAIGGSLNSTHWCKGTQVCDGFEALCCGLRRAMNCINSGNAFDAERESASIARNGTWQDRRIDRSLIVKEGAPCPSQAA